MRELLDSDWQYRTVGIDNGTNTVGYATLDTDLRTGIATVSRTETLTADRTAYDKFEGLALNRGQLPARRRVIGTFTYEYMRDEDPDAAGAESPFQHLHAHSFAVLCLSMDTIDDAVYRWRKALPFDRVPPGRAKKAVCPPGKYSNKKEDIQAFILAHPMIVFAPDIDVEKLSEHEFDGISVAYYLAQLAVAAAGYCAPANNMSVSKRSRK